MSTGQVIHLESVDSTNEYLKRRGALLPDGTVAADNAWPTSFIPFNLLD